MSDAPIRRTNLKQKKKRSEREREVKEIFDPRFIDKPNVSKHLKNYSFIYSKELLDKLNNREERSRLESELVSKGKKKFFMKKKHIKALEKPKKRRE